ncbi:MAG TPA: hypothetical protein VHK02_17140 [Actinomycetota bacterium]|jgi:hypothetical protein|nr:hypothetical protein [Actinomycetota bacterium]
MAPVRRRTTALLLAAGLLLVAVAGLAWYLVGDDGPSGGTAAGVPATAAAEGAAAGAATTGLGTTAGEGVSPTTAPVVGGSGPDASGPPAPPAPACQRVLSDAEAAAALEASVTRTESRDGFLLRSCTYWTAGGRYLLVQVSRGVAASKEQYELSRLPADRDVARIGQAARWTRDTGLLDVLDGGARFQVGLFSAAGTAVSATEPPPRLEDVARAITAHL